MVSTRGTARKRKTPDPGFRYFDDEELWEVERIEEERAERKANLAIEAAAAAEEERKRLVKQRREEEPQFSGDYFELLPPELLTRVMSFVPSATDLYSLSRCNKSCRSAITTEMIVRSAVFGGEKKTKNLLSNVMKYVENRSIHTPSKWRLLRLLNGRVCERMGECYGFDLVSNISMYVSDKRPFGLCICDVCLGAVGNSSIPLWRHPTYDRVAIAHWRVLVEEHHEYATGDSIGSLLLGNKLRQIVTSYDDVNDREAKLLAYFDRVDDLTSDEEHERTDELVDLYLKATCELEEKQEAEKAFKLQQRREKQEYQRTRKRERSEPILEAIIELLDGYAHRQIALEGDWTEWSGIRRFDCSLSSDILGSLLSAPSSATNSRITSKVQELKDAMDYVHGLGLASGSQNLLSCLAHSSLPHVKAIYDYRYSLRDTAALAGNACLRWSSFGAGFVAKCHEEGPFTALFRRFSADDLKNAFVHSMVSRERGDDGTKEVFRELATAIWGPPSWHSGVELYHTKFQVSSLEYSNLAAKLRSYLRKTRVKQFLSKTAPPPARPYQGFTRRDALSKLVAQTHGGRTLLRAEDWSGLFGLHRAIFSNPQLYRD